LERTYASLGDAETGQRGFLLTGDDAHLEPFHAAAEQIPQHRARLDSLGLDGPALARFDSLVDRKLNELGASIAIFRTQGPEAARGFVLNYESKAVMDSLRGTLSELGDAERRNLAAAGPLERDRVRTAILTISALSLVGLVVLGSLFITVMRFTKDRQRALMELNHERTQLEERVKDRTAALENELTQRLNAERARHVSETQHRTAVEQIKDHAIFSLAPDGTATSWNHGVRRVLGFEENEFIGLSAEAIFLPEDVQSKVPWRELADAVQHGVANNDRWMQRKDGTRFYANGSTTAVFNDKRELIGFSKVMRDETASREREEALRASETRYRLVALASREAIWDWDISTGALTWNEAIETLFGYSRDKVDPQIAWWHERIHSDERQRVIDSRQTAIDRGEEFWTADYRFRRADGQYATVTDRGFIAREHGLAVRMLGTIADVTERRRTDEKLSQAQRMEAVGRLAGGIAHDLNNMLTAIVGFSTLLDQEFDAHDRRRRDVAEIMKAAERSATLTRSLLAFARREIVHPEPLDMNRIVLEMGRMLRPAMGESINVEMALEPIAGTVLADRARLEQVILNIALNARDAMPAGGRLSIATRSVELGAGDAARHPGTEIIPGRYVKLTISDTGQGMDPPTLARIFEPFFTTKQVGEGTGLGLSTAYGTVKQAGGFVWAYSEPGHGSAFTVYLPEKTSKSTSERGTSGNGVVSRGGSETVLVVEDEEVVRDLTERILVAEGYHCLTAANGPEALAMLERNGTPVDLLITDIVMPGMGGGELARVVRQRYPRARVLFTSGFTDDEVVRRGLMDVGQPFMEKPWSADQMLYRVRELLDENVDRTGWNQVIQDESVSR
jgi:PAS domain S-box-containing protein